MAISNAGGVICEDRTLQEKNVLNKEHALTGSLNASVQVSALISQPSAGFSGEPGLTAGSGVNHGLG